ncbi:MAG: anti-sigma factor [Actinomycetota bacterium]|nr:anti-sigma factor [Actinomycetota bacterium]
MSDEQCGSAAAYVVSALTAPDRADFETHLVGCAECGRVVDELGALPALLSRVSPADLTDPPPAPETLLPRLLAEVRRSTRRHRIVLGGLAAAAVVATVFVTTQLGGHRAPGTTLPAFAMQPVATSPIHATAALDGQSWGTRIVLVCTYDRYAKGSPVAPYALVVTDRSGSSRRLATWSVVPNQVSTITGSTDWEASDIATVRVLDANGATVLRLHTE